MIFNENPYGEKCPQRDIKKISREICEKCPYMKGVYRTFSMCYIKSIN